MKVDDVLNGVVKSAKGFIGDMYGSVDDEGFIVCEMCGKRKEKLIELAGRRMKVPVLCDCGVAERERRKREMIADEERIYRSRLKEQSMMDASYADASFEKASFEGENGRNVMACKKYAERFNDYFRDNQGLLLYGDVGTGKSYTAACIANQLMDRGASVLMTSFVKLVDLVRRGNEEQIMDQIKNAKLVIFDDLGAERNTDYALEKVFDIVDTRYRTKKPMIVTTNIPLRDMTEETDIRYKRIYDRIFEVCYPMAWKGKSWRKKAANERFKKMGELYEN